MADFNVRSDSVNVEQIMEQIRARIREKRGVDYTEQQIRELAAVKLEKFLDPRGVRSDLLERFRTAMPAYEPAVMPNYSFEEDTLFESHRGFIRFFRKLFRPLLKLFFNPNPLIQALNIQARLNTMNAERDARHEASRRGLDQLYYELIHNLVLELTRTGIEVKNLKMRVESLTSRLEFNERRARALESVVVYKPAEDRLEAPAAASNADTGFVKRDPGRGPSTSQGRATSAGWRQTPPAGPGQAGQTSPAAPGAAGLTTRGEARRRRPAVRPGDQRRRRAACALHRGTSRAPRGRRGADDVRLRLRHVAQRARLRRGTHQRHCRPPLSRQARAESPRVREALRSR